MHVALAGQSLAYYFTTCLWPFELTPISPYKWPVDPESPLAYAPWLAFALAAVFIWSRRATWGRHALLGLGFFVLNLLPFIGFNTVSYMGFTWVMDHFLYLPMIGLIGLVIAVLDDIAARLSAPAQPWLAGAIAVVFALLAFESESYAAAFAGPEALWTRLIAHNPTSWLAHNNLATVYLETNRRDDAIAQLKESLILNPGSVDAHTNLGFAYEMQGCLQDAPRPVQRHTRPQSPLRHHGRAPRPTSSRPWAASPRPSMPTSRPSVTTRATMPRARPLPD